MVNSFISKQSFLKLPFRYLCFIYFCVSILYIPLFKFLGILAFSRWKNIHLSFNYADEFVKRGLIGSLFYIFKIPLNKEIAFVFALIFYTSFVSILFFFIKKFLEKKNDLFVYFLLLYLLTPAGIPHFAHDIGRFDIINYSLLFLALVIYNPKNFLSKFTSTFLIYLSYFIHEASFFYSFPVFLLFLAINKDKKFLPYFLGISCLSFFIIMIFGHYSTLDPQTYFKIKISPTWGEAKTSSHLVLFSNLLDNLKRVYYQSFYSLDLFLLMTYFGLILATYVLFCSMFCSQFSKPKLLLFSVPFWIFPLFLVGIDYSRWVSLFFTNCMIISVFYVKYFYDSYHPITNPLLKLHYYLMILLFFFGPLGIIGPFPLLTKLLTKTKALLLKIS